METEERSLQAAYEASRSEAKRLVVALARQSEGDSRSITERLAELDLRANRIETRLAEIQKAMLAMASRPIDRTDIARPGSDPKLLQDTIEAVIADRVRNKPALETEQRSLQAAYEPSRSEAKRLVVALARQSEGNNRSITERLAELDLRKPN